MPATITVVNGQTIVQAGENTAEAARQAGLASASATAAALSEAVAEALSGPIYTSTALGIAGTVDGDFFPVKDDPSAGLVTIYENVSGAATSRYSLATTAALAASTGAALVGKGSTTLDVAVPLTAKEKGALGDGSTSDTTALATASTALAGGGKVHLTPGTYLATVTIDDSQHWSGEGSTSESPPGVPIATTLKKNANGAAVTINGYTASLSNLHIDGNKASFTGVGVQINRGRTRVENVSVHNSAGSSFSITPGAGANVNGWFLKHPISYASDSHGVEIDQTASGPDVNAGIMLGGDIRLAGGSGVYVGKAFDDSFICQMIQACVGPGMTWSADAQGMKALFPYLEGNDTGGTGVELLIESGSVANMVIGNRQGAVSNYKDENDNGKNFLLTYEPGIDGGRWLHWGLAVWNPNFDGSNAVTIPGIIGSGGRVAFRLTGALSGTAGSTFSLATSSDGGVETERLSIDHNGLAVIQNSSQWLFGKGTYDTTTPGATIYADGTPRIDLVGSGTGATTMIAFYNGGGGVGSISTSGGATTYATSSDERLKENIADADDAGELIDAIRVRQFDWKATGEHQAFGMIAQELQPIVPEAVAEGEYLGVDYSKLVPVLLKELQALRARVAALEARDA